MADQFVSAVASNLVAKLGEYLFAPIGRQLGYVLCYKSYVEDLKKGVDDLENARERVQDSVYVDEDAGKTIFPNIKQWLDRVKEEDSKARKLLEYDKVAKKAYCRGWVPNPMVRHPIGRKTKKMTQVIEGLIVTSKGSDFQKVSREKNTSPPRSVDQKKLVLQSRASITENVLKAIVDYDLCVIGVWGEGGVGKTELLEDIKRRVWEDKLFDVVVTAHVPCDADLNKIQGQIADALKMTINEESASGRARCLLNRLETMEKHFGKKILIILDNLRKELKLKEVGIPCDDGNKVRGCKLLLTSRYRQVLTDMGCEKEILLNKLGDEESRELFKRTVGGKVNEHPFNLEVDGAVKCCEGLPLLIVFLAKKLKNRELSAWKSPSTFIGRSVLKPLVEQNYEDLEERRIKLLFLIWALASGSILMRNSLVYYMGLGLFKDVNNSYGTIENARDQLIMDLKILRDYSLLIDSDDMKWFKMRDQFVDVANSIASTEWKSLVVERNRGFETWSEDELGKCMAISSLNVGIHELPKKLGCPNLIMLLLFEDNSPLRIPKSFFKSMKKLLVLDLTGLSFTSLPSSIKFLRNLKSLCLKFCHLEDVRVLGKLKGLQFLSFLHSTITQLPIEIGGLTKLRFLDMTGCTRLEVIDRGVLRSLVNLEELYMEKSFHQWEAEHLTRQSNASLAELKNMKILRTLYIAIPHYAYLPRDLPFGQLKNYKIQIGDVWDWSGEESRTLKLKVDSRNLHEEWVQKCLQFTQDLYLDGLQDGDDSVHDLCSQGFEELKYLHVQNSSSFQYIVRYTCLAFPILESLFLQNLNHLKRICRNDLVPESFSKLKIVKVENCCEIEHLFPLSMMRIFFRLEEIEISICHLMQEIITDAKAAEDGDEVPESKEIWSSQFPSNVSSLKILKVEDCKLISSIIPSNLLIKLQNLEAIIVERCKSIQEVFNLEGLTTSGHVEILSQLTQLTLSELPSLELICSNDPKKALCFRNLRALKVQKCEKLKFLFSSYMAKALRQIEEIEIVSCEQMEKIMDAQEEDLEEAATTSNLEFPCLTFLSLEGLLNLKTFSSGKNCIQFPSLTRLRIFGCPKMMTFSSFEGKQQKMTADTSFQQAYSCINSHLSVHIFFNHNVLFPSLEELKLSSCGVRRIWHKELPEESFCRLASITVEDCKNLSHIFPSTLIERFQDLKMIEVVKCTSLKALIEHVMTSSTKATLGLPSLTNVRLNHCHSLRYLFTNDTARTLDKLEMLDVSHCNNMQEVVAVEECEEPKWKAVKFSNLHTLKFDSLESLISFSSGSCPYEFPSLKEFTIENCKAVEVIVGETRGRKLEGNVPMQQPLLLVKKVEFPSLESMEISRMDNVEKIWLDNLASNAFSNLKTLTVGYCEKLPLIFSSNPILAKFENLQKLTVTDCSSLEVVFHFQELNFSEAHSISRFQLRELVLLRLPNMKHVWSGFPEEALTFGCLQRMEVEKCKNLKSLFPSWVAKSMTQLEEIVVSNCEVEEIVAEEDGGVGTSANNLFFSRLTTLRLLQLPKLRGFSKNSQTSTWPYLRKLRVRHCGEMRPFSFDCETPSGQGSTTTENQHGLFSITKVIPHLEHIKLEDNDVVMMHDIPGNRRELVVENEFGYGKATPWEVLTGMGIPITALGNLKRLWLIKLYPSISIGFPKPTSFQSLTELIVEGSYNLVHLGTCSALTGLVHLTQLVLKDCDAMEDVVIDDRNVAEKISFPELEELILDGLKSLKRFSLMNCAFMFPSLLRIMVKQCPELTIFCEGALETPKLRRVLLSEKDDEGRWEDDLNTTIQTLRRETIHTKFIVQNR